MDEKKRERLEKAGWQVVSVRELLDLTDEEAAYVELKVELSSALRRRRKRLRWSQEMLASRLHSSQSRVAKIESADPTVSLDLLIKALIATGVSGTDIARSLGALEAEI